MKSSAKHTPGPWRLTVTDDWATVEIGDEAIRFRLFGGEDAENDARAVADARLIFAAPDLLAACRAYQAAFERCSCSGRCDCLDQPGDEIRAAIAKATKESP